MERPTRVVPAWAIQFIVGIALVLLAVGLFSALVGTAVRGPGQFFEELGRTVSRLAPQPQSDLRSDEQLRAVIAAMPEGKLRVGSIVEEQDRVVFTVTADRAAVKAAIKPGDELRLDRTTGEVEIVPTGIPGVVDELQRRLQELKERFFGK
ncbi:MAG TPA: hypothetical protein VFW12_08395 [Candidatus Limnocylindria bacterium]|nr:hypothetical protein [Candidatus Limnocylindria bacterium]